MRVRRGVVLVVSAAVGIAVVAAAGAAALGSLELRGSLQLVSTQGASCPPGSSSTTECFGRRSTGRVPGLGAVTVTYAYAADVQHPSCSAGSVKILGYPVRFAVPGKGELAVDVAARSDCLSAAAGLSATQGYTITGGTGALVGASGSGTVTRSLSQTDTGAAGRETWTGTLAVAGVEFDLTRPALAGVANRIVRAAKGAKSARVTFRVTARDDRDGVRPVTCSMKSGSRFRVGRTRVSCSAADTSGNLGAASFWITVKARP